MKILFGQTQRIKMMKKYGMMHLGMGMLQYKQNGIQRIQR